MKYVILNGLVQGRVFNQGPYGWRYMPFNSAQRTSRKGHPTPEAAIKGRTKGKIIEATTIADAQAKAKAAFELDKRTVGPEDKLQTVLFTKVGDKYYWPSGGMAIVQEIRGANVRLKLTLNKSYPWVPLSSLSTMPRVRSGAKPSSPPEAEVEIEVCERLMHYGWLPHVEDGVYKGLRQVPKYHASIKGKKHWGCGMSRSEAIGSLIQSHPEMFNISVIHLQQKLPR